MNNNLNIDKLYAISGSGECYEFELPLTNTIKINGKEETIQVDYNDNIGLHIIFKNKTIPVEIVKNKQNKYEIILNSISYNFSIETPFSLQRMKMLEAKRKSTYTGTVTVKAPMPGKIVDVLVQKDMAVAKGETLVILEAMKMENEILSPVDGTIVSVITKPQNVVMKDELLIEIKAS